MTTEELVRISKQADHWKGLAEFAKWEIWAGGPDPHMVLTAKIAENDKVDWSEKAWRGLCYIGTYVVPSACWIWKSWPWERVSKESKSLGEWIEENWKGIALRRERKCVRTPVKMTKYLNSAVDWLKSRIWDREWGSGWLGGAWSGRQRYDVAWDSVQEIYGMGRYVGQKFLEYGNRYLNFGTEVYDIRAKGGWSPRTALALLWPEKAGVLLGGDSPCELVIVDQCAGETKERLHSEFGLDLTFYQMQVCLCDYKQSYVGRRQFPGRSQDSEISYDNKIVPHWGGLCLEMYVARKQLFPSQVLGELNGWDRVRKELGDCLTVYGYTWTDARYDYNRTKANLACPVRWRKSA